MISLTTRGVLRRTQVFEPRVSVVISPYWAREVRYGSRVAGERRAVSHWGRFPRRGRRAVGPGGRRHFLLWGLRKRRWEGARMECRIR